MTTKLDVHSIYRLMQDYHIQFSYKGPITQDVLISLSDAVRDKLKEDDCDARVVRKVFSILIESSHNILKYSSEQTPINHESRSTGVGLIGIGRRGKDTVVVFSGNIVSTQEADYIRARLEAINQMTREEIKKSYSEQLKQGSITENGSAGLGLYEVARKSDRPIEFDFTEIDEHTRFFEMKIFVNVED